ncbi:MAG: hypothetical protein LBQ94_04190 [Treponema sp.]|jgi:hypothetical protein|nr:hypothetical protein [Treponema sp.]
MKKRYFVRLCVIALAIGLIFAGCDLFAAFEKDTAEPLVLTGTSDGKALTITIRQGNSSRAVLTPKSGDNYEIRLANELVSKGKLSISGSAWTFTPSSDSPNKYVANAVYSNGTLSNLTVPGAISNAQASTTGNSGNNFVAVTGIAGVPTTGTAGVALPLTGTVVPAAATNKTIAWTVKSPTTGATITGNALTAASAGTVVVTATIVNGTAQGTNYTRDFSITIGAFVPVTGITGVPTTGTAGIALPLTGAVAPATATNKTIAWTVKSPTTGATITENALTATSAGAVVVTATIVNGTAQDTNYAKDFSITIGAFVPVTYITDVPTTGTAGVNLPLTGTVDPTDATNKTITWAVKSAGTTGATIAAGTNVLRTTAAGTVTVTATIANGKTATTPYTQDFSITIDANTSNAFVAVTWIWGVPTTGTPGVNLTLTGTVYPDDATNKTITWTVKSAGATGATIAAGTNVLRTTAAGTVTVTATIANGLTATTAYTQDCTITIRAASDFAFQAIAYGGGRFVAGGYDGFMAYSDNGIDWTRVTDSPFDEDYYITGIAYGGGRFIAVGFDGYNHVYSRIAYSADGQTWTRVRNIPFADDSAIGGIAYSGSRFIAVGMSLGSRLVDESTEYYRIPLLVSSTDGTSWSVSTSPFEDEGEILTSIAYGNGNFVVGSYTGKIAWSSNNGTSWTPGTGTGIETPSLEENPVGPICFGGNNLFVAGFSYGRKIAYSDKGETWEAATLNFRASAIAYGGNVFVAVGEKANDDPGMVYSSNGKDWTAVTTITFSQGYLQSIAYGGEYFVAGSYLSVESSEPGAPVTETKSSSRYLSPDGINWTKTW